MVVVISIFSTSISSILQFKAVPMFGILNIGIISAFRAMGRILNIAICTKMVNYRYLQIWEKSLRR